MLEDKRFMNELKTIPAYNESNLSDTTGNSPMIRWKSVLVAIYGMLLKLYPAAFKADFAEEMQDVFVMALDDASEQGFLRLLRVIVFESIDLPLSVLREHLYVEAKIARADRTLYQARWITRTASLLYVVFFLLVQVKSDTVLGSMTLFTLLQIIAFIAVVSAWRWEISGGIGLAVVGLLTGIIVGRESFVYYSFVLAIPAMLCVSVLAVVLIAIPFVLFGIMFISLGRRAQQNSIQQ